MPADIGNGDGSAPLLLGPVLENIFCSVHAAMTCTKAGRVLFLSGKMWYFVLRCAEQCPRDTFFFFVCVWEYYNDEPLSVHIRDNVRRNYEQRSL